MGILGHDLRSPLSAISMGARLLLDQRRGDPLLEQVLSRILASSDRMSRMIDQILETGDERGTTFTVVLPRDATGHGQSAALLTADRALVPRPAS